MFFRESSRSSSFSSPTSRGSGGTPSSRGTVDDGDSSDAFDDRVISTSPTSHLGPRSSSTTDIEGAEELRSALRRLVGTRVYISVDLEGVFAGQRLSKREQAQLKHCVFSGMVTNAPVSYLTGNVVEEGEGDAEDYSDYFIEVTNLRVMDPYVPFIELLDLGLLPATWYNLSQPKGRKPVDAKDLSALFKLAFTGKGKLLVWHEAIRSAPTSHRAFTTFSNYAAVENASIAQARLVHKVGGGIKRPPKAPLARGAKRAKPLSGASSSSTSMDFTSDDIFE
jgi:hypothetical protein